MKKKLSILLVLTMLLSCITPAFAQEKQETMADVTENGGNDLTEPFDVTYEEEVDAGIYPYDDKTVLVKLAKKSSALSADGITDIEYLFKAKDGFWYTANLAEGTTPKQAIEALRNTDGVLLAEYNFLYEAGATTLCDGDGFYDDIQKNPRHNDEWHLDSCGIQKSWRHIKNDWNKNPGGDSGIVVAVIDTGVDYDHEDLKNNMWVNTAEIPGDGIDNDGDGYIDDYYGVDIVAGKGNGDDDHGHGTHVAGIIAAANNNVGVVGVAYNAKIMAIKAGQASGYFLQTDVCKAINYAVDHGADVINMSFGGSASTIAVQDALERAYTSCVLVAAAGNDGAPNEERYPGDLQVKPCYPAAYSFVLGVMSVDDWGVESSFTNYDVKGFNDVEYELYAPGNAITSTIPNNKYATWNGTSMAAPIVSGMAAVLRSVYNDPDVYPTKFIYGQLASTSGRNAICCSPATHGIHNKPKIVNLYDALTKTPTPDVSVSSYKTFDSESISNENNGDGTIDSGETIALGFELRNRWGMSKDTIVTIDALSPANIPNPYVEFSSDGKTFKSFASIDYGSVGTYSTQDCGKIMTDDLWTGWEKPFYVRVKKDAPNETILAINVNVSCKNALNEKDRKTYSSEPVTINLLVKNGVVLPQIIKEDMTLTKDNYYIIQNSTVIEEGATVTVTEGTNIQFWTNDSTDPYADSYMPSLMVKGTLNSVGTEEEPVKIFPSDLMGRYRVEIYQKGGTVNYTHTDITNLYTGTSQYSNTSGFTMAKDCEFNVNYKDSLYYRYLDGGTVKSSSGYQYICGGSAENCAFYKLGSKRSDSYWSVHLSADCKNCIFVDSNIDFNSGYTYENCIFYGNNNYWDSTSAGGTSTMQPYDRLHNCADVVKTARDEITGKTYLQVETEYKGEGTNSINLKMVNKLAEYMGGELARIETPEELVFLKDSGLCGALGAQRKKDGEFKWMNDEKLGDFITIKENNNYESLWLYRGNIIGNSYYYDNSYSKNFVSYIIELPGNIYIEDISLGEKSTAIDTSVTYQLKPQIYPSTASGNKLLYFSSNTAVATVDENGLVTPVDTGKATIYVFSEDMQVSDSMEINVTKEVKTTGITAPKTVYIDIGNKKALNAVVTPMNTTKKVTYRSSDESIVKIDGTGEMTAVSEGTVTITTTVSNDTESFESETTVYSSEPVTDIIVPDNFYIDFENTKHLDVELIPAQAVKNVTYESSDDDIITIDENGDITSVSEGVATITVTAYNDNENVIKNITVYSYVPATGIIAPEVFYIDIGNTKALNPVVSPAHIVKPIIYESSNEDVATVDEKGNITAVSEGTVVITMTVENDDGSSYSVETTVMSAERFAKIEQPDIIYIDLGNTKALNIVSPTKKATYESNNSDIVTVDDDGNITSVSEGSTIITVKVFNDDETISTNFVVHSYKPATGINVPETLYVDVGVTKALNAQVSPGNAVKKVTYESSDENIVYVDRNGNIKAKSDGTAIITTTVFNDDETYEAKTTVYSYKQAVSANVPSAMYIDLGNTKQLNVTLQPADIIKLITYVSSDDSIVTVDENGSVTSVSEGTATITTTIFNSTSSFTRTTTVYSYPPITDMTAPETLRVGLDRNEWLNVEFTPKNAKKEVTFESSDESIATVSESGYIYGKSIGYVTITAKCENDNSYFETHTLVHVIIPTEGIDIKDDYIVTKLSEKTYITPEITPENATFKTYTWESSDKSVCYVDENGKLIKNGVGVATLTVMQNEYNSVSDKITVVVTDDDFVENDKDIKDIKTVNAKTSYALLEDNTIWKWDTSYSEYGDILLAEKLNLDFDGTIDDFFVGEGYNKIFILSGTTMYESDQLNKGIISDFKVSTASNGSGETITLDNVSSIHSFGDKCYIYNNEAFVNTGYGFNNSESVYARDIYIDNYYDDSKGDYVNSTMYVYDGSYVYINGYYNGMYYDYSDHMKILNDIIDLYGGYAWGGDGWFVLGDSSHTDTGRTGYRLSRLTSDKYISYNLFDYDHTLYMNRYTASSAQELAETIKNGFDSSGYGVEDIEMKNIDQVFDTDNVNIRYNDSSFYYETTGHELYAWDCEHKPVKVVLGMKYKDNTYDETDVNLSDVVMDEYGNITSSVLHGNEIVIDLNTAIYNSYWIDSSLSTMDDSFVGSTDAKKDGSKIVCSLQRLIDDDKIVSGETYKLKLKDIKTSRYDVKNIDIVFTYQPANEETNASAELLETSTMSMRKNSMNGALFGADESITTSEQHIHKFTTETVMPTLEADGKITNTCECGVVTETIFPKLIERKTFTADDYTRLHNEFVEKGYNTNVFGSAILNRLNDSDVTKWLRITAPSGEGKYGFGGNWWGTTNSELINHQIVDYRDFISLGSINEGEILTEAPENTFPFVTEAYILDESGEQQNVISGGKVKFVVKFNRDMDTEYGLNVYFGSTYPYGDYQIDGAFADARTWVGETTLKTVIENGYQFIKVSDGRTVADENGGHLKLYNDWARFGFEIDTTSAMAMTMQGYADDSGVHLEWIQDDYDTLAGYNVYRAESENGNYVRINKTVIPYEETSYTDTDVEPGKKYYYTFTVVLTDVSSESKPAGKISITAKDTMAPNVYHSPVYTATTGSKVIVSATISDNIGVQNAKLYYRTKGTDEWKTAEMTASNDKYTASIPSTVITLDGVEYYIAAFDGVNYTYAGNHTSENPYEITVYAAVESNAKGDVDGDGNITVLDALKLLRAIYDETLLTQEEFLRADINGNGKLEAVEALRILQYANKKISSVLW